MSFLNVPRFKGIEPFMNKFKKGFIGNKFRTVGVNNNRACLAA